MGSIDELVPVREAGRLFPSGAEGKPVSVATIRKWGKLGFRGIRLELTYVGGRDFVSPAAVTRFIERATEAKRNRTPRPETAGQNH